LQGAVLTITLDNPPLNAMTPQAQEDLGHIWTVAGADPEVRAIVITGNGSRAFCAGGDLTTMLDHWQDLEHWQAGLVRTRQLVIAMLECPKPIIARINGHAMGFGATIALASDITIMVADATIGDAHVSVGLTTGLGGTVLWPGLIGLVEARRILLSGKPLKGSDAAARGLVTEAPAREELDSAVARWTAHFLAQSPSAVRSTKQALNLELVAKARSFADDMLRLQTQAWQSPNHPEAVRAILEKRVPEFVPE
jgi:enoyl-CoA hydratase